LKTIAIIGKPNVGKSSLFNRLVKERDAITSDTAGTTRDVKRREIEIESKDREYPRKALLLDTGGFDTSSELFSRVTDKALQSAEIADIILYMVDGRELPDEADRKKFFQLQKAGKKIALLINKMDNDKLEEETIWEFHSYGIDEIFPISISHNRKVKKVLNWIYDLLPQTEEEIEAKESQKVIFEEDDPFDIESRALEVVEEEENPEEDPMTREVRVAIIGRVNVGKSSLLNALTKSDRSVVSDVAGTTIDPIDEVIELDGERTIRFVDTAGIRRRGKIEGIEKYALMRTEKMLERTDVAILVLDSSEHLKELDERIAGLVDKHKLGVIIVLNKWDQAMDEYKKMVEVVRDRFKFLYYAPIVTVSALTHKRVHKLFDQVLEVYNNYSQRVPTSKLNNTIEEAIRRHHLPAPKGRILKIYYGTQYKSQPPEIAVVMNRPHLLHFSYKRYLINKFREEYNFEGTPIIISARGRGQTEERGED
jgi:GTP-binding protein